LALRRSEGRSSNKHCRRSYAAARLTYLGPSAPCALSRGVRHRRRNHLRTNLQVTTIEHLPIFNYLILDRVASYTPYSVHKLHKVSLGFTRSMSFQRSSALESQPTTWRREDDPAYADDPEFRDFADKLSDDLFALTRNVARLSTETSKLGTKHETARVRERVKTTVEETSEKFKEIGEGLKKITTWPDVGVCEDGLS
jgi:hypothetical protein